VGRAAKVKGTGGEVVVVGDVLLLELLLEPDGARGGGGGDGDGGEAGEGDAAGEGEGDGAG
jgi:hypothetical protein